MVILLLVISILQNRINDSILFSVSIFLNIYVIFISNESLRFY